MGLLGQETHTVTRTDGAYSASGEWVSNAPTTFTVDGTLLPLTGEDLLQLEEGQRTSAEYKLYSQDGDLRVADPDTSTEADQVERDGIQLMVISREDLSHVRMSLAHYVYILAKPGLTP